MGNDCHVQKGDECCRCDGRGYFEVFNNEYCSSCYGKGYFEKDITTEKPRYKYDKDYAYVQDGYDYVYTKEKSECGSCGGSGNRSRRSTDICSHCGGNKKCDCNK